ncbi:MAG TPA: ATP-binding protein [Thermoanaerobaculia bacterium]|nr:ATP-binding protein [Thermoanaerobaculia bacterium]
MDLADENASHARVDERTRLAREIHDTIAQSLTAIALEIEAGRTDTALRITRSTLDEAQRSVMNLRAEPLAGKPLAQALANVRRHARAKTAWLTLRCTRGAAVMTVEDDGTGFSPRRIPDDRHGVRGMRERARLAGGTLKIASRPGSGTRVEARVPR